MIAVIGCARSGTTYTSVLLNKLGLVVGNEKMLRDGVVSWEWAAKDFNRIRTEPGQWLTEDDFTILHQIRNPLDNISSAMTLSSSSQAIIVEHCKARSEMSKLCKMMAFWVSWNQMCERRAAMTYRIEDLEYGTETYRRFCSAVGVEPREVKLSKRINSRHHEALTWDDLYDESPRWAAEVYAAAGLYGYEAPKRGK